MLVFSSSRVLELARGFGFRFAFGTPACARTRSTNRSKIADSDARVAFAEQFHARDSRERAFIGVYRDWITEERAFSACVVNRFSAHLDNAYRAWSPTMAAASADYCTAIIITASAVVAMKSTTLSQMYS